jgi:hypothetical protein
MTGKADIRKWDKKKKRNDSRNTVNSYQESRATKFTPQGSGNSELIRPQSEGDLNMNTFDIINLDRMIFATDVGAGDDLASTETGIEAIATGAAAYGMKYQVPASKIHQFFIGTSEKINITTGVITINDNVTMGGYLDVNSNYIQFDEMTPTSVGTVPADERRLFSDSTNNSELSVKKSDGSVVSLEGAGSGSWVGTATSDLNMANYDINTLDRLLFSTTGTDNLGSTDMGIGTNSGDSDYLTYNVPSGYHRFKVNGNLAMSVGPTSNPGLTVENSLWVSGSITATGNVTFQQEITLGSSSSDDINIVGNIDTDISMAASKKIRAYTSTEIGYYVKNATSAVGSEGTIQIPTKNSGAGNAATADSDFGSEIGCIGIYTLGNPVLVFKYSSSGWQGIIFGSSGNPTQYQF